MRIEAANVAALADEVPTVNQPEKNATDHRARMAAYTVKLALDRTTLAWVRTTLTIATFGFGMIGFFRAMVQVTHSEEAARLHAAAIRMGVALVVIGAIGMLLVACSHWMSLRRLRRGEPLAISQWPLTITIAVLMAILGLYALWSLLTPSNPHPDY